MAQPLFSVITPVLIGVADVSAYVETLKRQTCLDWEAIVVDDCSTDGTDELLNDLIAGDHRFRYTRNTLPRLVPGPYQARNVGLSLARGEYVCFLDIDDRWLPDKLKLQAAELEDNPDLRLVFSA